MTPPTCRLLPTESLTGAENMAADEVMLAAAANRSVASVRFYTWSRPTLSLGYFQAEAPRRADPLFAEVDCVRRASGGAAILHHHELTYCLALPAGAPWQSRESWVCRFHLAVAAALREFGVSARPVGCGEERTLGEFLCFLHQTPGDLLVGSSKVVGSAQRKMRGALMQHGSILLRRSVHAPFLPGIAECSGREISFEALQGNLGRELGALTGWTLPTSAWTEDEVRARGEIARTKYLSDNWNLKR